MEPIISVIAVLVILVLGWNGKTLGVFCELTTTVLVWFAMMVALRYWYLVTALMLPFTGAAGPYAAFGAYWVLFLLGCVPLIVLQTKLTVESVPRYPRWLDAGLGLVLGLVAGVLLVSSVVTSLSVLLPTFDRSYDPARLAVPVDRLPLTMYRHIEHHWLGIAPADPRHTRFPKVDAVDSGNWQGDWE